MGSRFIPVFLHPEGLRRSACASMPSPAHTALGLYPPGWLGMGEHAGDPRAHSCELPNAETLLFALPLRMVATPPRKEHFGTKLSILSQSDLSKHTPLGTPGSTSHAEACEQH